MHITKKCPSIQAQLQLSSQPYYTLDINVDSPPEITPTPTGLTSKSNKQQGSGLLKSLSPEKLSDLLKKIDEAYNKYVPAIQLERFEFLTNKFHERYFII